MKKSMALLLLAVLIAACNRPSGRSWIIPVTIDPSDLSYTPEDMESYELRRALVLDSMNGGFLVLKSSDPASNNRHEFRPNNYFYYLTGYSARGVYLILDAEQKTFRLTMPRKNLRRQIYDGKELNTGEIKALYNPDEVLGFDRGQEVLDSILRTGKPVYADLGNRILTDDLVEILGKHLPGEIRDASLLIDELRVNKDPLERQRMQKACNITSLALTRVMRACEPGMFEFEMESIIEGTFMEYGAAMPGYPSIVGAGANSTTLHYEPNNSRMEDGDLLLMDVGAEYGYYTADITRTIPVNGRFTEPQRTIYQLVLDAQLAAIEQMKPGIPYMRGHQAAREVIAQGLARLGLVTDADAKWQVNFYCIHGSNHFLGLDVHDVGDYGVDYRQIISGSGQAPQGRELEPGMVLTIEPGIYFREGGLDQVGELFGSEVDSSELAEFVEAVRPLYGEYVNIGVRIEDDILITREGNINLSRYAPKQIADIEAIMN